jgi:hypothetical protein
MRHSIHSIDTTQIYTPFGGGYMHENHGDGPALGDASTGVGTRWAGLIGALLIGATTAAAALTATHRSSQVPKLWLTNQPPILMKLPDAVYFEELVF